MVKGYLIKVVGTDEVYVPEQRENLSVDSEGNVIICYPYIGNDFMTCHITDKLYAEKRRT